MREYAISRSPSSSSRSRTSVPHRQGLRLNSYLFIPGPAIGFKGILNRMDNSNSEIESSNELYRARRSHKKSRNGCLACKEQRKKCDEGKPSCSRCTRLDQACIYGRAVDNAIFYQRNIGDAESTRNTCSLASGSPNQSNADSAASLQSIDASLGGVSLSASVLDAPELEPADLDLLKHFLEHTSRKCHFEAESQYAWRVGIPNLAFRSSLLMHSVLAVSALCICADLMGESTDSPEIAAMPTNYAGAGTVSEMLKVAIAHHEQSLRATSLAISGSTVTLDPTIGIVNAYLMIPYAMMSFRAQMWLWRSNSPTDGRESGFSPGTAQPGWISSIRAAFLAVSGLRELAGGHPARVPPWSPSADVDTKAFEAPQDPTILPMIPEHALFSTLSSTAPQAMHDLSSRLGILLDPATSPDSSTCRSAFQHLYSMYDDLNRAFLSPTPVCTLCGKQNCADAGPQGYLTALAPWVQDWLVRHGRVRPTTNQGLPRRIFTFVVRMPPEYLEAVEAVLHKGMLSNTGGEADFQITLEQRIVVEIFAHWLVYLLLLDGIWCIGDLAIEELRLVITILGGQEGWTWLSSDWWPARMLRLAESAQGSPP